MKYLLITKGLPASGKSTFASKLNIPVVNRDTIRLAHNIGNKPGQVPWTKDLEKTVVVPARNADILKCLSLVDLVICDDTNLHDNVVNELKDLARSVGATPLVLDFTNEVSLEECIRRDKERVNSVGVDVIMRMAKSVPAFKASGPVVVPAEYIPNGVTCGIVDLDGTLADMGNRSPYDESRVLQDKPRRNVVDCVRLLHSTVDHLFVFSGRSESFDDSYAWIKKYLSNVDHFWSLKLRTSGDHRRDSHIKYDLFNRYVRGQYSVKFVFDDRPQVLRECWYPLFPDGNQTTIFSVGNGREF